METQIIHHWALTVDVDKTPYTPNSDEPFGWALLAHSAKERANINEASAA